jgi:hypothetical protein
MVDVYVILDYDNYTLGNVHIFSSKKKLINYVKREYGDLLDSQKGYIDWEEQLVYDTKKAKENNDDPLAVISIKTIR